MINKPESLGDMQHPNSITAEYIFFSKIRETASEITIILDHKELQSQSIFSDHNVIMLEIDKQKIF